jgi:glycosyltransferase involved in cell wall biosynthesis
MKIGIDIRMFGVKHGGIGRYIFELVKNIFEIDSENEYFLFYNEDCEEEVGLLKSITYNLKPITYVLVNIRHYSLAEQIRFPRILNKYNLDLMHFPNFNAPIFYKKPFVATIHDTVHHKIGGAKKSHILHFLAYKKVIENCAKNAIKIITVSEYSKKDIEKYLHISKKIKVIYQGGSLNTKISEKQIEEVREKYFLRKPYFLFVGVLERKKNIVNLTRGFDLFIKNISLDIDLVIAGKTDIHYPNIKHNALDITNREKVVFTDFVEDEDLEALYAGSLAYVNASVYEGFGLPGVEAMRFGKALAVSNIEVFNEIYDDGAIYFDPFNVKDISEKLQILASDRAFLNQLEKKAFKRASYFSWEITAKETLEVYKEAVKI